MAPGKVILFVAGLAAGAALMFVVKQNDVTGTQPAPDIVVNNPPQPVSPFATVEEPTPEEPIAEPTETLALTTEQSDLLTRVTEAELRIRELEMALEEITADAQQTPVQETPDDEPENADLRLAGFEPAAIEEIENIRNTAQLERLELRDLATREGWVNTDRFRQANRDLNRGSRLRDALGDEDFDKLLLAEGRNNRVRIEGVIDNSAAALAGIETGDIILRYSDERIFSFRDLRTATTSGDRDQPVTVQVIRDGEVVDLDIPRGPMGVNLIGVSDDTSP